jgi:hypothetical protein
VRRLALAVALAAALAVPAAGAPAFSRAPRAVPGAGGGLAQLVGLRASHHRGYDRIVFTFRGARPAVDVRRVARVVADGSGLPVRVRGRAFLSVVFQRASRYRDNDPRNGRRVGDAVVPLLPVVREVRNAGDFEAVLSWGIGLSRAAPFRVMALARPPRVVVDVAAPR